MFENNAKQELAIKRPWVAQKKAERIRRGGTLGARIRMHKNGAMVFTRTPHLDRKVRRCYPRGPAFEAMILEVGL